MFELLATTFGVPITVCLDTGADANVLSFDVYNVIPEIVAAVNAEDTLTVIADFADHPVKSFAGTVNHVRTDASRL